MNVSQSSVVRISGTSLGDQLVTAIALDQVGAAAMAIVLELLLTQRGKHVQCCRCFGFIVLDFDGGYFICMMLVAFRSMFKFDLCLV